MENIEQKTSTKKYISYSQMSMSLMTYGLFLLIFMTLIKIDKFPIPEFIFWAFSALDIALFFVFISVFCGISYYFCTAYTPYSRRRDYVFSLAFPCKETIFNFQFKLLFTSHFWFFIFFISLSAKAN
ncbi:MAG: hypothetical protein COB83_12025 [Gammaproteobacteria bacterium]|nr:MAG: hypothetical protein COB83_12025 [Gammaproteobacteria bacterium]